MKTKLITVATVAGMFAGLALFIWLPSDELSADEVAAALEEQLGPRKGGRLTLTEDGRPALRGNAEAAGGRYRRGPVECQTGSRSDLTCRTTLTDGPAGYGFGFEVDLDGQCYTAQLFDNPFPRILGCLDS